MFVQFEGICNTCEDVKKIYDKFQKCFARIAIYLDKMPNTSLYYLHIQKSKVFQMGTSHGLEFF